jgi:16S rRNA (cytosine967-C5)-methyltransferase
MKPARQSRKPQRPPTARQHAFRILKRVEQDGAFASILLQQLPDDLESRDVGLVTELVYGSLRHRFLDEYFLGRLTDRSLSSIDPDLVRIFRLAAHQILRLDRIPDRAAVHEAVETAKRVGGKRGLGGSRFINAVLRRLCAEKEQTGPPAIPESDAGSGEVTAALSVRFSHPRWMIERWLQRFGLDETMKLLQANNEPAPVSLNVPGDTAARDRVATWLGEAAIETVPSPLVPGMLRVTAGAPQRSRAFKDGKFYIQDEASGLIPLLLNPSPGATVLDACAAPGGKGLALARMVGPQGMIIAADFHLHRMGLVRDNCRRMKVENIRLLACDSSAPPFECKFEYVLVDAPCTGSGVFRRDVEARYRLEAEELQKFSSKQANLLSASAELLGPGGRLLYSVCSIEPEEGPEIIQAFLSSHPGFSSVSLEGQVAGIEALLDDEGALRSYPHKHGMDGFYAAAIQRI